MLENLIVMGTLGLGVSGMVYGMRYQVSKLNREYGSKFTENLSQTQIAIKNKDYDKAEILFREREALFNDSLKVFDGWFIFADNSVKEALEKSKKLEENMDLLKILG